MKKHYRKENDCLNCGAELQGHFCHVCGQENLEIKENFGHLMGHAISDYFHFDEKFFHTMKPLLFQPGKLTIDYMAGKRTQYLHPVRIYIFISLVFFVLLFSGQSEKKGPEKQLSKTQKDSVNRVVNHQLAKYGVDTSNDETVVKGKDTTVFVNPLLKIKESNEKDTSYAQYLQNQQKLSPDKRDGFLKSYYKKRKYEWKARGETTSEAIGESFKHNFPKMMFLLLPLFAMLLRFTFWKNHKFYVEHLIYAFHLHCFIFLFLTLVMLCNMALPQAWHSVSGWLDFAAAIAVTWYVYRSLRVIYQRSRWRTVWKMIGLSFWYTITFSICALFFVVILAVFS
jgi:hypothetical protein